MRLLQLRSTEARCVVVMSLARPLYRLSREELRAGAANRGVPVGVGRFCPRILAPSPTPEKRNGHLRSRVGRGGLVVAEPRSLARGLLCQQDACVAACVRPDPYSFPLLHVPCVQWLDVNALFEFSGDHGRERCQPANIQFSRKMYLGVVFEDT